MKNLYRQSVKQKYSTLYHRVSKAIQTGKFSTYTAAKKQSFYNRLKRYERRLKHWGIAVASSTALFLSPIAATAQTPAGTEFSVNTYTTNNQRNPSIGMDSDGDFVIALNSSGQDGSNNGVYAQRYNSAGAPQGTEFLVNTYTASDQRNPSIGMDSDSDGDFVIAWQSRNQDGSAFGVYAQQYNSAGAPQGTEFLVNTYTTSYQYNPSVGMDNDGDFVIAWESYGQDGSGWGVYAQRYAAAVLPVELTTFTGTAQDNQTNLLEWQTATEENNFGFEVERSTDGKVWKTLDFVQGHGTTVEVQEYTYTDETPLLGNNYYRLKQVDFDEKFEYSNIVLLNYQSSTANPALQIYPNPAMDYLVIKTTNDLTTDIIQIFNVFGQEVKTFRMKESNNQYSIADLAAGTYFVKVGTEVQRIIVSK
jgi:hypothetical protein